MYEKKIQDQRLDYLVDAFKKDSVQYKDSNFAHLKPL